MRILVFNENHHELTRPGIAARFPLGIHGTLAAALRERFGADAEITTATQDQPGYGLGPEELDRTDVLVWWSHLLHAEMDDGTVARLRSRVLAGMGLVVLHSGAGSKLFTALMGTSCDRRWRHGEDRQLVWTVKPGHPIAAGVPNPLVIPHDEMYGEPFDLPDPDELVFISWFSGGEVLRSGACYHRGAGKIFYFSPGDQECPVYHQPEVQHVIANAVRWAAPSAPVASPYVDAQSPEGWWAR
ncbi:ThuA domain-containing protein [Streptacidiphilus albus]|uniref:ThuA domain-containing protein n=1 Tax=Streptacidiphilus albus TaxID=105425 RepID=UPI00054B5004|nr:ThuA domain-containing protein [Streptacidiphilus albus]